MGRAGNTFWWRGLSGKSSLVKIHEGCYDFRNLVLPCFAAQIHRFACVSFPRGCHICERSFAIPHRGLSGSFVLIAAWQLLTASELQFSIKKNSVSGRSSV